MAIAFGGTANNEAQTVTIAPSGDNLILFAGIWSSADDVTAAKFNSDAMTLIAKQQVGDSGEYIYLYYLINPDTGSHTLTVTGGTGTCIFATYYTGAKQTGVPDAYGTNTATTGTSITKQLTTTADNCWIVGFSRNNVANGVAANDTDTLRNPAPLVNSSIRYADSNNALTPAGNFTAGFSNGGSNADWGIVCATFAPYTVNALTQTCSETLSLTDTISRSTHFNKSISETLSMTEAVSKSKGMSKTLTETLSLSDAISSAIQKGLLLLETLHITDTLQKTTRFAKTLTESISLTDTLASAKQFFVTLSETIGLTDVISKSVNFAKTLSETLHLKDIIKVAGWWWSYLFKRTSSYDYKSKSTNTWTYKDK